MSSFRQPDFLTSDDEPRLRIRCPIHGFIHFSEHERRIIDHPLVRRLRHIRQLALTEYIYPGASHTRFEHTLGVMELATKAFDALASKWGGMMEAAFVQLPDLSDKPLAKARQILRLAALLHDSGHASFSHAAEDIVFRDKTLKHEALSVCIATDEARLGGLIAELYWPQCAGRVGELIEGGAKLPPQLSILRSLISGQIDADRTDYLLRDSYHCGVDYGRFDYRRMIETLAVVEGELGSLELALDSGGIHTFEALILARYQMNSQVYYHRLRRIYDLYLKEYHRCLPPETFTGADDILRENDVTMMARLMKDAENNIGDLSKWAKRIVERRHHREIHATSVDADAMDVRRSKKVLAKLQARFDDIEFLHDIAKGNIHKLWRTGDREDDRYDWFSLYQDGKACRQVGEVSVVLRTIPREFQCARIYADLEAITPEIRKNIIDYALQQWREEGEN